MMPRLQLPNCQRTTARTISSEPFPVARLSVASLAERHIIHEPLSRQATVLKKNKMLVKACNNNSIL